MKYSLHRGAEADLAAAAAFYRQEAGRAVAARFLDEFERVATLLLRNPELGIPSGDNRRWFPLHGFPYSIIYRRIGDDIRILVVRHQNRAPNFGAERR